MATQPKTTTILIPTFNRFEILLATLTSLTSQDRQDFDIVIANQGDSSPFFSSPTLSTLKRILAIKEIRIKIAHRKMRMGMAEQRQFLLKQCQSKYCLYLDDDVILDTFAYRLLITTMQRLQCGFVGMPVIGLSYLHDERPLEQQIEFIEGVVEPELVTPTTSAWARYKLHNAANPLHIAQRFGITPQKPRAYKVAWVGGAVLYDRRNLLEVGGFDFGTDLPLEHSGEDVLAQLKVMRQFGGCGVLPSGAYHQEAPTTLPNRSFDLPRHLKILTD